MNICELGNCKKRTLEKSKLFVVQVKYFDQISGSGFYMLKCSASCQKYDRRRISCLFTILKQSSIVSFIILPAHDMKFWGFKMLIILKFRVFIIRLFAFVVCVLSSSNSTNHSCNSLKFHESMINMIRIGLLLASPNIMPLWKL